jgi:fatty acid amide hydrolase
MQLVDPSGPPSSRRRPPDWHRASLVDMKNALDAGLVSSSTLTETHLERIRELDREIVAFAAVHGDAALEAAARLDEERRAGQIRGPLHGLPVSIKECFDFEGRATTLGVASRRSHRAEGDAAMVRALREAGAIVLGRANCSQMLATYESDNPLFGRSVNPFSPRHSAGGSSGGDAAAVAAGLAPLGIGTDLAGSVRVPAHFCGVCALLPTRRRLPNQGNSSALPALLGTVQTALIARAPADLGLVLDALTPLALSALDADVPPVTELPAPPLRDLAVGVFTESTLVAPSAALVGAVDRARDALRALGLRVVPFVPPRLDELYFEYLALIAADGGKALRAALGDDPVAESLRPLLSLSGMRHALRSGLGKVSRVTGDRELARLIDVLEEKSGGEIMAIRSRIAEIGAEIGAALDEARLDALLCPPFATPAIPHGTGAEIVLAGGHAAVWNALGYPAGVVPVTRVHGAEARRDTARGRLGRLLRRVDEQSAGLPVGVQVVARPWQDRTVVALLQAIADNVKSDVDFPRTPVW